jgi:hypothetical protein
LRTEPDLGSEKISRQAKSGTKSKRKGKRHRSASDEIREDQDAISASGPSHLRWIPIQDVASAKYVCDLYLARIQVTHHPIQHWNRCFEDLESSPGPLGGATFLVPIIFAH